MGRVRHEVHGDGIAPHCVGVVLAHEVGPPHRRRTGDQQVAAAFGVAVELGSISFGGRVEFGGEDRCQVRRLDIEQFVEVAGLRLK